MAGILGAGGLGDVAIRYGLYRYDTPTMLVTLVLLVLLVQTMQEAGMKLAKIVDRRIN
jgi:D-methionine transport system permease protein